jgi:hypothetical protein
MRILATPFRHARQCRSYLKVTALKLPRGIPLRPKLIITPPRVPRPEVAVFSGQPKLSCYDHVTLPHAHDVPEAP